MVYIYLQVFSSFLSKWSTLQSPLWMMCSATICKWKILGKIVELVKLPSTIDFVNDFAMDNLKFPLPWLLAQMIPMKDNIV